MVAGVTNYSFLQGKREKISEIFHSHLVPLMKQSGGAEQVLFLFNPMAGKVLAIGLWENHDDAKNFFDGGLHQEVRGQLKQVLAGLPIHEIYEVEFG